MKQKKHRIASWSVLLVSLLFLGASCGGTSDGGFFVSTDSGTSWARKIFIAQQNKKTLTIANVSVGKITVDPTNPSVIYIASKNAGIYKTETGGDQWRALPLKVTQVRDIAVDPKAPATVYALVDANILQTTDGGDHWQTVYTDAQQAIITHIAIDWFSSNRVFATTSIGTVLFSEDAGQHWRVVYEVDEPLVGILISTVDSRIVYVLELDKAVHKTIDGGQTWENVFDGEGYKAFEENNDRNNVDDIRTFAMDPNAPLTLYVSTNAGIIKTTDGGDSWSFIDTLLAQDAVQNLLIKNITVQPGNSQSIFFTVGRLIHKTTDGGHTWQTIEDFISSRPITSIAIPTQNTIYAGVEQAEKKKWSLFQIGPK
ncbi:MAG: hypothetical protein HYV32_04150 [Candidatus Kerfeldbacteria bacterium]|nr:hypothetical protein [Candidatus Kerfeldbacteria bacterium]